MYKSPTLRDLKLKKEAVYSRSPFQTNVFYEALYYEIRAIKLLLL